MKIGVDAYYLYTEHIDGLGNFLLRLLKELSRIDQKNEYFLYTPGIAHHDYADAIITNEKFHLVIVPGIFRSKRRLWLQSPSLRKQILCDGIDMFFAGAEYFPLFLPASIFVATTIHDVAYKAIPDAISFTNIFFYKFFFPFFVKRSNQFFTVSHYSKEEMIHYLSLDSKIIIPIHNGIDLSQFPPAKPYDKKDYILFVGTLQPRKNLANLVKAFSIISEKITESLIVVGGSGWKNSSLRVIIDELPNMVRERIFFKGYVDGDDLARLYREAKVFALPSLHEGFCFPILEAMASGTAVLTAQKTAIPEIFGDAVEYANPFSPEDIAMKLYDLLTNNRKRTQLQKKGLLQSRKYDVKIQAAHYLSSINEIAKHLVK